MANTQILRKAKFICEPNNITIHVDFPVDSRSFLLTLKVDDVVAIQTNYKTEIYPKVQDDYNKCVIRFCDRFISIEEDDLYTYAENYMGALNIYRNLKKVFSKLGKTIWNVP
jgi:hypothetical protein